MHIPHSAFLELYQTEDIRLEAKSVFSAVYYMHPANLTELCAKAGIGRYAAVNSCRLLVERGWMRLVRTKGKGTAVRPICWVPKEHQEKMAQQLKTEYDLAPLAGEFLLGKLVELWIDAPGCVSNARPGFLVNPATKERLELDRYIPGLIAFEHNGLQHYVTTEMYADDEALAQRRARDLIKAALCAQMEIPLVTVTAQDLDVRQFRDRLPATLLLHYVDLNEPYATSLDRLCSAYRKKAQASKAQGRQAHSGGVRKEGSRSGNEAPTGSQ